MSVPVSIEQGRCRASLQPDGRILMSVGGFEFGISRADAADAGLVLSRISECEVPGKVEPYANCVKCGGLGHQTGCDRCNNSGVEP